MKKKMIEMRMTPDPALNRAAMPPEIFEDIERFLNAGIDVRLTGYRVEQGSVWAEKAQEAMDTYRATVAIEDD